MYLCIYICIYVCFQNLGYSVEYRGIPPAPPLGGIGKRGVCYLSRVPPHMNPSHIRQMLSKYGEVLRIYLVPEGNQLPEIDARVLFCFGGRRRS